MVVLFSARCPNIKDYKFQDANLLTLDILASGSLIWSSWSPNGTDEANYEGENIAMISRNSMAAPHIAGIAALIKQKHPHWHPATIKTRALCLMKEKRSPSFHLALGFCIAATMLIVRVRAYV